ncbi:MAG: hypothetical protein IKL07_05160 [Clostridium sp.]|nr:hypothetical protein [Clostridium sp.]
MEGQITLEQYRNSNEAHIKVQMEYPIGPLPCPFCGAQLKEFPMVMIVTPVHNEEYLLAKLNKGNFLGTDNWFHVHCIRCGSTGGRGQDRVEALIRWNERGHSALLEKLTGNR